MAHRLKEFLDSKAPIPDTITKLKVDSEPLPDLTPEEEQAAILAAREEKLRQQKAKAYWDRITSEPVIHHYTAKQLYGFVENHKTPQGKKFIVDNDNREIVELLCYYFSNDPLFEGVKDFTGANYSLRKGLAMIGGMGVGKTLLMGIFHQNQNQSYTMANCRKIESKWVEQMSNKEKPTVNVIDYYAQAIPTAVNGNAFGHQVLGVCFDDLGTETVPSKAYGEEKIVLQEILMNRYESGLPFNYTHFTSNLSAHEIGLRYGNRIKDRFREMFNLIVFDKEAKSRRS